MVALIAVVLVSLYGRLLFGPVPVSFLLEQAHISVKEALPDNFTVQFGQTALALENGLLPIIKISPVNVLDSDTGAEIAMDALDIGFSPLRALFGQPGARVTMVAPRFQVVQDLFGPRLTGFELVDSPDGEDATIWVTEGDNALPAVTISADGLDVRGAASPNAATQFRSDNDWLIYNLIATEQNMVGFKTLAEAGVFSQLRVRGGHMEMHDPVYGLLRAFSDIKFQIAPALNGEIHGDYSAKLAGREIRGNIVRKVLESGEIAFQSQTRNIDFASMMPFVDDPDGNLAIRGVGTLGVDVVLSPDGKRVVSGVFDVDLSGTDLRIKQDLFPVVKPDMQINWTPELAQFEMENVNAQFGKTKANLSAVFLTGLDEKYGPTVSVALTARDVVVHPEDMEAPDSVFDEISFSGWSAPLYGALGIDQIVARKPGVEVRAKGRADVLRTGTAFTLEIEGEGASADDMKRIWPYFMSTNAREWFVANVEGGTLESASMKFDFPLGTLEDDGEEKPLAAGTLDINMVGLNLRVIPQEGMDAVDLAGRTTVQIRDNIITAGVEGAQVSTDAGAINVGPAAFIIDNGTMNRSVYEISGDLAGDFPALLALTEDQFPGVLDGQDLPINPTALVGALQGAAVATIVYDWDDQLQSIDYAVNGTVTDFASKVPIENLTVQDGQLKFSVSPGGYSVAGSAVISGIAADVALSGEIEGAPDLLVSATVNVAELAGFGFDPSEFIGGQVRFAVKPMADGALQFTADLRDAALTIKDLGIRKEVSSPGTINALILPDGDNFDVQDISVSFDDVDIRGRLDVSAAEGLKSAEFSTFKLSANDSASLAIKPINGGVFLRLRGEQLDLKPMLRRFFALDEASTGGPQSTQFDQAISLDIELKRAIGFYRTIGYNLDLEMDLVGEDLRRVSMQAQFAEGRSISVATNRTQSGRTMSVAFNDAGTLLRFLNVYPRLLGGQGTLTLAHNVARKQDRGVLSMQDFSIVDEEKVVQVLGNHRDSRALVESQNQLTFNNGRVQFIRSPDRIEVTDALLEGETTGGTMRGFVYTQEQRYDLIGTYVPLFALNSIFQKLPVVGQLLGGRDGEGLVGVTFAIRGALDNPEFLVNPASILLPGAFRSIMEFKAQDAPVPLR